MKRFEYTVLSANNTRDLEIDLMKYGEEGWELVSVTSVFMPSSTEAIAFSNSTFEIDGGTIYDAFLKREINAFEYLKLHDESKFYRSTESEIERTENLLEELEEIKKSQPDSAIEELENKREELKDRLKSLNEKKSKEDDVLLPYFELMYKEGTISEEQLANIKKGLPMNHNIRKKKSKK